MRPFVCELCGEEFVSAWSQEESWQEARDVFGSQELADVGVVCDPCWQSMREQLPELDERYRAAGL